MTDPNSDQGDDLTERSERAFRALRERLESEYGDVETVDVRWRHPPGMYEDLIERFEAGHPGGAGAWVHDDRGRVLLVRAGPSGWTDPGGKRRPDESYPETARRAVRETTGVQATVEDVLELHRVEVFDGTDPKRPTLVEPVVVFLASASDSEKARHGSGTDVEPRWFDAPPEAAAYEGVERRPIPVDVEQR